MFRFLKELIAWAGRVVTPRGEKTVRVVPSHITRHVYSTGDSVQISAEPPCGAHVLRSHDTLNMIARRMELQGEELLALPPDVTAVELVILLEVER